ncbi:inositol oxygenase 1-like [Castanea sativa]|uniref:inositol oxygenase 1-like n=1 Tax=Castanea sativa TaxID=21020 RepID=UPI003F650913
MASGNQNQFPSSFAPLGDLLKALMFLSNLNGLNSSPSPSIQGFPKRKGSSKMAACLGCFVESPSPHPKASNDDGFGDDDNDEDGDASSSCSDEMYLSLICLPSFEFLSGNKMIAVENQAVVSENAIPKEASDEFTVPESNAFGQSFRDYEGSVRLSIVENCYRLHHINQTYDFVKRTREEYAKLNKAEMSIWEAIELLDDFVDESDPDLDEPQIQHMLQTAEAIRKDYPNEDWLHLTALIHDVGKVLYFPQFGSLPQWAVVGDTFIVGCAYDKSIVYRKYLEENPDYNNPAYNTKLGVYSEGCGLENVLLTWGHDDYMYMVYPLNLQ